MFNVLPKVGNLLHTVLLLRTHQVRNAVILKRRFPARLAKIGGHPKLLKRRNFIYDFVEDTNTLKQEDIQLILTTFVEGYGNRGDILSVRPKAAREQFLLPKLAVYASPENIAKFEKEKQGKLLPPAKLTSRFARETTRYLLTRIFLLEMNMNEPWTVEPWHLRVAFRRMGCVVPESAIQMPSQLISGPDPEKEGKEFAVFVSLNQGEPFPVRFRIRHWINDPLKMTPLPPDWYKQPTAAVLSEQIELLSSMPSPEPLDVEFDENKIQ